MKRKNPSTSDLTTGSGTPLVCRRRLFLEYLVAADVWRMANVAKYPHRLTSRPRPAREAVVNKARADISRRCRLDNPPM